MLSKRLQISRKVLAYFIAIMILFSGSMSYLSYNIGFTNAQGVGLTANTLTGGTLAGAPSYTIFVESGTYYVKNQWGSILTAGTSTNLTKTIQTAVDASTSGEEIHIVNGVYSFAYPVSVWVSGKENIVISGEGAGTEITQAAGVNIDHFFRFYNSKSCELKNIRINGNNASETSGTSGIVIHGTSSFCKVTNCYFDEMPNFAIQVYESAVYAIITNNKIENCTNNGIQIQYTTETAGFNVVMSNTIYHTAFGVGLYFADHNDVSSNQIQNNPAVPFNEGINLDSSSFNTISDNHIVETGDVGISVHNQYANGPSWYNVISNNVIKSTAFHGIHLINYTGSSGIQNNVVTGNIIVDCNDNGGSYDGIKLENVQANTISSNTIIDDRGGSAKIKWGIQETGGDYNVLIGDRCVGCVTGGIILTATNSKANLCYNGTSWIA